MSSDSSDLKEAHTSIAHVRQEWPEDAYVAWKREHYSESDAGCPDDDAEHCAFMSGITYAEESITARQKSGLLEKSIESVARGLVRKWVNEGKTTRYLTTEDENQLVDICLHAYSLGRNPSSWLSELLSIYDNDAAISWLTYPNEQLDGFTPLGAIRSGSEADVARIVQQLTSGVHV